MRQLSCRLALLLAVPVLLLGIANRSDAQTVVVQSAPTVTYYTTPPVYAPAPVYTTYRYGLLPRRVVVRNYYATPAPVVTYAPPPPVVTYAPPVVTYPAPVVTYAAPVAVYRRPVVRYYYPRRVYVYP